jgi:hypothetical protein
MIYMVKKIINSYFELLDKKLENWTFIVLIIALLVVFVSILINNLHDKKYNVTEKNNKIEKSIIEIDWKKYQLIDE